MLYIEGKDIYVTEATEYVYLLPLQLGKGHVQEIIQLPPLFLQQKYPTAN